MQSKKPIYKKEYEQVDSVDESVWFSNDTHTFVDSVDESVWFSNDTPIDETDFTFVFDDRYPCVTGHTLFIPKENNSHFVGKSLAYAYDYGNEKIKKGEIEGFNVGMNIGLSAGQTIMWPHIHFIPRHKNDAPEIGGMRHAHPGADHKKYY